MKNSLLLAVLTLGLGTVGTSEAITILSGPSFTRANRAPLAGTLDLTTDVPSRVSVSVSDGGQTWERSFYDYQTTHSVPLFGFKTRRTNNLTVTVWDRFRNSFTAASVAFITGPLPPAFPRMNVLVSRPDKMEPGYTLFRVANTTSNVSYVTFVDNQGEVVWYSPNFLVSTIADVVRLDNGNLFIPLATTFVEVNLLGEIVNLWRAPNQLTIDPHDGVLTDRDSILFLNTDSRVVSGFPTSATDPYAPTQTATVRFNRVIEMSATNSALLNNWSVIDLLDPLRITYLTFTSGYRGWDSEHANAVIEDPRDDSLIVSLRHQNAVIKFSRDGQLKWILGPPENWGPDLQSRLLTPVGTPFEWNYAQHAPMITPRGTLLVFDNGNFRANPFDPTVPDFANYSRAVEYDINEQRMEVTQMWEYGGNIAEPLYADRVGNADWLPNTGNVLVTFGSVGYINCVSPSAASPAARMVRIKEVTHDAPADVVFDLSIFDYNNNSPGYLGYWVYRSRRVPDLYGHPPAPVADLAVKSDTGAAHLQFSGDPARNYVVETSTDLNHWTELGAAQAGEGGTYDFLDPAGAGGSAGHYYRVVTR
ncbi:MAG TPA: aryl-sulfate sulfotransferase [Verrucomicrobiae bacterium]